MNRRGLFRRVLGLLPIALVGRSFVTRANADRYESYVQALQDGWMLRADIRDAEGEDPICA